MEVLIYLASRDGEIVQLSDLLEELWPGKVVTSASIYNCITELRSAFQNCHKDKPYVETVPKRGYRLVAPVTRLEKATGGEVESEKNLTVATGHRREIGIIALLSLALLVVINWHRFFPDDGARLGPRSVLVLPFSSNQKDQADIYADGLLGEILVELYKIKDVTTVGLATSLYYRGSDKPVKLIAEESGVAAVMSGSLIEAADQLRFDVELLEAETGRTIWANNYELPRAIKGSFRVQSEIAIQIASALQAKLSPVERQLIDDRTEASELAYSHYLRGEVYYQRTRLSDAIAEYEQATTDDPGFALAWAALAKSRAWASYTGLAMATMEQARFDLREARQLAPDAYETQLAQAVILSLSPNGDEAEKIFRHLSELRPSATEPLIELSAGYAASLRLDQARRFAERAVELDPMNIEATWQLAFVLAWSWKFHDARKYYDRVFILEEDFPHTWRFWMRYNVYLWGLGDTVAARQILDNAPANIWTLDGEIELAYVTRDLQKMQELFASAEGERLIRYGMEARYYRLLGDFDRQKKVAETMRVAAEAELETLLSRAAPAIDVELTRSDIAVAMALAGNEPEAIRTIQLAVARASADPDRLNAVAVNQNEILTYIFLGQYETAMQRLRSLLSWATSPNLTVNRLRMDPDFDVLRDRADFESLLEELRPLQTDLTVVNH
jgi:TolB-like protein/DNA-binding winged helix-turn-helix (wHTH) protein/Tfp pilus assembly protein PilF